MNAGVFSSAGSSARIGHSSCCGSLHAGPRGATMLNKSSTKRRGNGKCPPAQTPNRSDNRIANHVFMPRLLTTMHSG